MATTNEKSMKPEAFGTADLFFKSTRKEPALPSADSFPTPVFFLPPQIHSPTIKRHKAHMESSTVEDLLRWLTWARLGPSRFRTSWYPSTVLFKAREASPAPWWGFLLMQLWEKLRVTRTAPLTVPCRVLSWHRPLCTAARPTWDSRKELYHSFFESWGDIKGNCHKYYFSI